MAGVNPTLQNNSEKALQITLKKSTCKNKRCIIV